MLYAHLVGQRGVLCCEGWPTREDADRAPRKDLLQQHPSLFAGETITKIHHDTISILQCALLCSRDDRLCGKRCQGKVSYQANLFAMSLTERPRSTVCVIAQFLHCL